MSQAKVIAVVVIVAIVIAALSIGGSFLVKKNDINILKMLYN